MISCEREFDWFTDYPHPQGGMLGVRTVNVDSTDVRVNIQYEDSIVGNTDMIMQSFELGEQSRIPIARMSYLPNARSVFIENINGTYFVEEEYELRYINSTLFTLSNENRIYEFEFKE